MRGEWLKPYVKQLLNHEITPEQIARERGIKLRSVLRAFNELGYSLNALKREASEVRMKYVICRTCKYAVEGSCGHPELFKFYPGIDELIRDLERRRCKCYHRRMSG